MGNKTIAKIVEHAEQRMLKRILEWLEDAYEIELEQGLDADERPSLGYYIKKLRTKFEVPNE